MLGLEYILMTYNVAKAELATKLGFQRQYVSDWFTKKRPIPKKYLPLLSKMFDIPEELFTKELSEIDKLAILKDKLEKECARVGVEAEDVKSLDYYIIKEQYNDQNKHVTIKSKKD